MSGDLADMDGDPMEAEAPAARTVNEGETSAWPETAWREHARAIGCHCANYRKPCQFHEGYDTGEEEAVPTGHHVLPDGHVWIGGQRRVEPILGQQIAFRRGQWRMSSTSELWMDGQVPYRLVPVEEGTDQ